MKEPSVPDVDVKPSCIEGLGIFARRPMRAGERIREIAVVREVTPDSPLRQDLGERADHCDYPDGKVVLLLTGGSSWPCHCGAARCRGTVGGDLFSLPPAIQREYRPLLADWFVRRHSERLPPS